MDIRIDREDLIRPYLALSMVMDTDGVIHLFVRRNGLNEKQKIGIFFASDDKLSFMRYGGDDRITWDITF